MNIIDLATKSMQTAIKAVVDSIKTTTDVTKTGVDNINTQIANKNVGKVMKSMTFTSSGTFYVPAGVTEVYITGGGAGGGGGFKSSSDSGLMGGTGGATSFGNLLTLSGGSGGTGQANNLNLQTGRKGGPGGQDGEPSLVYATNVNKAGNGGNSGPYFGGRGFVHNISMTANFHGGYCSGGGGSNQGTNDYATGGGGGDFVYKRLVTVNPLSVIPITIGIGGIGAGNPLPVAGNGGNGILTVEWWE